MIIETTDNRFFRVTEIENENLDHLWWGVPVKKVRGVWVDRANGRRQTVRKAGSRVVESAAIANVHADIAYVAQACGWV